LVRLSASNEWLNTSAVACRLGCSTPTVLRLINTGKLPATRVGHFNRVRCRDLEVFEDSCTVRPQRKGVFAQPSLDSDGLDYASGIAAMVAVNQAVLPLFAQIERQHGILRDQAEALAARDYLLDILTEGGIDLPPGFKAWPAEIQQRWIEELHALYFPKVS